MKILRYRRLTFLITMSLIVLIALSAALLSPLIYHNPAGLVHAKTWLDNDQLVFLYWRLIILIAIFLSWPWLIRYKAKQRQWPVENIKKAIQLRYYLIVALLLLNAVLGWGQV